MKIFQVLKQGFLTTVQDLGRFGFLRHGVPISGAMDTFSFVAANLLVSNDPNAAGLETTLLGPELQVLTSTDIAITGGESSPEVNHNAIPMWQSMSVQKGDIISFGRMKSGCRSYIAVRGGIKTPLVLGSRSTYLRGGFGGFAGRQLKAGDVLEGFAAQSLRFEYKMPVDFIPQFLNDLTIHVTLGPQEDVFTGKGIRTFLSNPYKITLETDRMGLRLEGQIIERQSGADIISDALLPGAIQVPRNGKPIVLMRDAQTTGGYPKIAVVVEYDLTVLGQAKPNDVLWFSKITLEEAHRKLRQYRGLLNSLSKSLIKK